jgi:hypothetical protein
MESNLEKKEAIRKFKEQKPSLGAYAVRCTVSGQVWVGASRNLEATRNGCWFTLRSGGHMDKPLQQEWNTHGEAAFQYEILETLEEDLHPMAIPDLLKQVRQRWVERLQARPLL